MRFVDWPKRLSDYVASASAKPFAWGQHDCLLFTGGALEAMTGKNALAMWNGGYDSALSAARKIVRHGGLERGVSEALKVQPIAPTFAQRGDMW
jgi:hypothetical protein